MGITATYEEILATKPGRIECDVLVVLEQHVGAENAITVDVLAYEVFDHCTCTRERKTRRAIQRLRRKGGAVLSESGKSGRRSKNYHAEREVCVADIEIRHHSLEEVISALHSAPVSIPVIVKPENEPQQGGFWE